MKQYITPKQLNKLSEEGKRELAMWFIDKNYTADFYFQKKGDEPFALPIPNMGQMIEFLDERRKDVNWWEGILKSYDETEWIFEDYKGELCDALFEAVKEVLEQ